MKRKNVFFLFLLFSMAGCGNDKKTGESENDVDAARNFIRCALDGKFNEARTYMLADSANTNFMDVAERNYQKADPSERQGYRASSIRIFNPVTAINDSTTIIIYSNSFKNDRDTLKVLRINGRWLIDLKYLYEHDTDSIQIKPAVKDSMP